MILDYINWKGNENYELVHGLFLESKQAILYHGTSSSFKDSILEQGLQPPIITGNSVYRDETFGKRALESNPARTYLGTKGSSFSLGSRAALKYGGDRVIFSFLMDLDVLYSDEDSNRKDALESLAWEGCCSHLGAITPDKLLGYYVAANVINAKETYHLIRDYPSDVIRIERD